jgi:hypothetical protein
VNIPGGGFVDPGTGSTYGGTNPSGLPTVKPPKKGTNEGLGSSKGADFFVPPGYPNDSYPMRVESGERVIVIPKNQQGNVHNNWNIYTNGGQQPYEKDYNLRRALAPR